MVKIDKNMKLIVDKFGKNHHNIFCKMLPDKSVSGGGMIILNLLN